MTIFTWRYRFLASGISALKPKLRCASNNKASSREACCAISIGKNERGASAVILAVVIMVLLGMTALATDVGQFFLVRSVLQTAADSGALAAAQDLADQKSTTTATNTAEHYVHENVEETLEDQEDNEQTEVTFPNNTDVRVNVELNQPTFFGAIFGQSSVLIRAKATAGYKPISSMTGAVPIIIPFQAIEGNIGEENGATFNIGQDNTDPEGSPNGFFWLVNFEDQGVGVPVFEDWIINGYPGNVSTGLMGRGEGMKAALRSALAQRQSENPNMIVPLYDFQETAGGSKDYHVVGFAEFVITGFNFQGGNKNIQGYFTTGTLVDGGADETPPVIYGIYALRLKE